MPMNYFQHVSCMRKEQPILSGALMISTHGGELSHTCGGDPARNRAISVPAVCPSLRIAQNDFDMIAFRDLKKMRAIVDRNLSLSALDVSSSQRTRKCHGGHTILAKPIFSIRKLLLLNLYHLMLHLCMEILCLSSDGGNLLRDLLQDQNEIRVGVMEFIIGV
eukprot:CAMPEP_0178437380 /NCGR_PEP_ID=MMETSP0689_2-20121128/34961_1 /TAXON_ID=160604 /ORGANISM="Amphidinium massartii, Strain CS-259" /LENGTH=162 /DNA_ID=CAMNT_0020059577 /DNA_START=364 /DNA_END=848 /DNA_ORIENTATION=-